MRTIYKKQRKNTKILRNRRLPNIYQNELDKACFQHDMAYGDFNDLARTASDKILCDKVFSIPKNPKYAGYQRGLASMAYIVFDKKSFRWNS